MPGVPRRGRDARALKPDLCSVATGGYEYGSDHYLPTLQALDAGCHVLCEKPICNDIAKAEEMVARPARRAVCFGVNLNHRFTPAARLAKKWLDEGRLGHLLFVNMSMWIKNPTESSPYFQIKALHPHTVDVMRYFCGDIEAVQCFATKAPGRTIWSTAHFTMRFRNGVGRRAHRQLRHRARPPDGALRGGRHRRALRAGRHVARGDALSGRQPGEDVYTNPVFGGLRDFEDTFRNRIHALPRAGREGVRRRRSTAPARTGWPPRRSCRRPSSR